MLSPIRLDDRYLLEEGVVYLTGMQALVRLPIDQNRRDRRTGLRTATFISGYPGSPIAGYDLALTQARPILERHDILHVPGANEELAATAISGTQMLDDYPHSRVDGVVSLWYGKGPGVDRSGDAFKHGNFAGTSRHGAVVVLSGEDHESKSSTMPHQNDYAFASAGIPIVYPASTGEFLHAGLHAIAMSRYSGCWVAMKLVSALADGGQTITVNPDGPSIVVPDLEIDGRRFEKSTDFRFFPGITTETERRLYYERHRAVRAYARANHIDRIVIRSSQDRIGIVTAGKSYADTRAALLDMGLDDRALQRSGVRLLCIGLIYPADPEIIREFAAGLDEVIVIEEKRGFLESQVKEAICDLPERVRVIGKFDESGLPFFPIAGGFDADLVVERLGPRLRPYTAGDSRIAARLAELSTVASRRYDVLTGRTPNYCSGCPHNTSTRLLEGQVAWGSPGCHSFASIIEQPERHIVSMTQLGGEGLPWVGLAPFTDLRHIVQNTGDGSLFHSSYLNIRFCVAAGVTITFKILYNGVVANTGAQSLVGGKSIPELTRLLQLEGVARIAVVSQHPEAYRGAQLAANARVHRADEQDRALRWLEEQPGVTIMIYDGACANERRRRQKRGTLPIANTFVVINPDVCEACGDCGALTNCMSLHRIETEFGDKTQIHTSSCNQDYSCLRGDCPSFVTIETQQGTGYRKPSPPALGVGAVPEPSRRVGLDRPYHISIPGVGGTGVLTLNALLAWAALLDGHRAITYDQTGAAQKWGPVLSNITIAADDRQFTTNQIRAGQADLYLACDLIAAAARGNLRHCAPDRTAAVVNMTLLPTGEMIRRGEPSRVEAMSRAIACHTDAVRSLSIDARRLAEALFGDYMATNVFLMGAAYQAGLLPLSGSSVERAIGLNGVDVSQNLQAFRYGRLFVAAPDRVRELVHTPVRNAEDERDRAVSQLPPRVARAYLTLLARCSHLDAESQRMLAIRIRNLIEYQDASYPTAYVDVVLAVADRERAVARPRLAVTHAVVRQLYKLMAYKDEYEVARLHTQAEFHSKMDSLFVAPQRVTYHLHPPLLRALGLRRKLRVGGWVKPGLRALYALRRLRGTPFDVFGFSRVRQEERRLIDWYAMLVQRAAAQLTPHNYSTVLEIALLPDQIRGYEEIKLRNVAAVRLRAESLMSAVKTPLASR